MRLSLDEKDPGFLAFMELRNQHIVVNVRCNGVPLDWVVLVDEEANQAEVLAHDEWGVPILTDGNPRDAEWVVEKRFGIMAIELVPV